MQVVLGIGCDRNTPLETLEQVVNSSLEELKLDHTAVKALATIDKKNDEVALLALAKKYQWPLVFFTAKELAKVTVPNPSEVVMKYMGTPAVAEAAAILAAKTDMNNLMIEKNKYRGHDGKNATVSVVRINNE
ncbi:MAG: cobalamin biosynthesis protein [Woeseiaceae bacterium]